MTARDVAAWLGAAIGVLALGWEVIRWRRDRPRLEITARANMPVVPEALGRPILGIWVTNTGTAPATITMLIALEFSTWNRRARFRPARTWHLAIDPELGPPLPCELLPGEQWIGGVRQNPEINRLVAKGSLYVGIYRAGSHGRPTLAHVKSSAEE